MAEAVLEVLDPVAEQAQQRVRYAPRPARLDGVKVGLLWNSKVGGDIALKAVAEHLARRFPGVQFQHFRYSIPASEALLDEVAASVQVAVATSGD